MPSVVLKLDMMQALALAAIVLFGGYGLRRRVGFLDRCNIPAPVVGGAGGQRGFGLGATPNAVANLDAIVERFGPAPRAFLVVPMVGAFFIDFTHALIITTSMNWVH